MTTFQPITLTRGVILGQDEAINWMKQLFAAASGEGIPGADKTSYRCDVDIFVLDHPITGTPLITSNDAVSNAARKMKFTVHNAWITSLNYSDLNATGSELMFETMTLVHEGLSIRLADYGASVPVSNN